MINDIFFKAIANLIYKVYMYISIVRVNLTATFIDRHKYRFDTRCCLGHQRSCTCWSDCQTGNITTTILHHIAIEFRICVLNSLNERILLLSLSIIDFKGTSLLSHCYRRAISIQSQCFMH